MSDDRVLLGGMVFYAYHGVVPEENTLGQRFVVDVEMTADLRAAGESDDLTRSVDYTAVYADVKRIVEGPPRKLVESVAESVAARILEAYPVESVRVRVLKPDVPIPAMLDHVGVEVVRTRGGRGGPGREP